jgi:hypothetical protein
VTTDFDIIEDMLVKDWDVAYSFEIRYKHLLVNRQGQQETDEDIDHILGVDSGQEDSTKDEDEDDVNVDLMDDDEDEDVDNENEGENKMGQEDVTGQYLHANGYTNSPHYPQPYSMHVPPPKGHKIKQEKTSKHIHRLPSRPQPPSSKNGQLGYGQPYGYGPPLDPWGRPMLYGGGPDGYGGYGMYGGYAGYTPLPDKDGRHPSQPPGFYGMGQYPTPHHAMTPAPSHSDSDRIKHRRAQGSPFGGNKRMHESFEHSLSSMIHPGFHSYGYPQDSQPSLKCESPESDLHGNGRAISVDKVDGSTKDLGEDSNAAAVEAELRATELELKVARLQAKRAAMNQQSRTK